MTILECEECNAKLEVKDFGGEDKEQLEEYGRTFTGCPFHESSYNMNVVKEEVTK